MANKPMLDGILTLRNKLRSYKLNVGVRKNIIGISLPNDKNTYLIEMVEADLFNIYRINSELKNPRTSRRKIHANKTRQEILHWAFDYAERKGAFDGTLPIPDRKVFNGVYRL